MVHKKTWECSTVSAYLRFQALALPLSKDKQLELAHVVHIVILSTYFYKIVERVQYTLRGRSGCVSS